MVQAVDLSPYKEKKVKWQRYEKKRIRISEAKINATPTLHPL